MRTGERYHADKLDSHYDAIVIGSGVGGLTAAVLLAKAGKKVLVLERHTTAGGFTHTYKRKGYEWDVGVHYIGEAHREHGLVRKMFDFLTNGQLKWQAMGEVYDRMICGDVTFDFVSGHRQLMASLIERYPEDETGIKTYFAMIKQVKKSTPAAVMTQILPKWLSFFPKVFMSPENYHEQTTAEVLERLIKSPELRAILATQWGDCGLTPQQSSFTIHAMIAGHYMQGAAYPVGGSAQIAACMAPLIEASGGKIMLRAEVAKILVEKNRAVGVRLSCGDEIRANQIISSVGVPLTYNTLLDEELSKQLGMKEKLKNVNVQGGHLCLYIGLKKTAQELNLKDTNLWIFPSLNHDENVARFQKDMNEPFPLIYISFPSVKDPDWERRFPGRSTIEMVTLANYDWFSQWESKPWLRRGEDYEALKEGLSQRLLATLYEQMPHLKGEIDYFELSTPLSTRHFCNYEKGEIYGLDHDPKRFQQKWLGAATPIDQLYLAGQDAFVAGVVGAMTGGMIAGVKALGLRKALTILPKGALSPSNLRKFL